uniref:Reverse transcriptase domain-containing protein n=1 Tax=Tanacetum cinerariifolium TaxID=118510 RepID=A0A6L2MD20_TANCI|nr:reverse transcriptase domain-containing protein [Tanacetum cinerariifolium]
MIRTPYRLRVLVETPPIQEGPKSPRSILEVDSKEDPEEDLEEDPKEDPKEEEIELDLESTSRSEAKPKELEDTCASDLQNIIPQIVTQVTISVNNANANCGNGNGRNENDGNDGCSYKEFLAYKPRDFNRKGGAIVLTRWIEKMESVMDNSGCDCNQKVKYATSLFINMALTWWNTQVQARGRKAAIGMTREEFKALIVEEFCPNVGHCQKVVRRGRRLRRQASKEAREMIIRELKVGKRFMAVAPHRNE